MNTKLYSSVLTIALALLTILSATGQGNPNPNPDLDAFINEEMELENFPGVTTVIVKDGNIVWLQSYGLADVENNVTVNDSTVFLLASISKLFTGTAAMQLHQNNTVDLDSDVNELLPWVLQIPNFPEQSVTMRHLMTHSSSIQDNYDVMDGYYDYPDPSISLGDCVQRYFDTDGADYDPVANFLPAAPGTAYEYSNMATALNGYLVERATGIPFDEYCNTNIFEPLCMNATSWYFSDFDSSQVARPHSYQNGSYTPYPHYGFADYPDGQLRSTSLDLANFMIAMLDEGNFGAESLLSPSSINEMLTPQVPFLEDTQGLNWYQETLFHSGGTALLWGHNGGEQGCSTDLYIDPVNKIGLCVLTNGEGDPIYICDELYDYALSLSSSSGYTPGCLTTTVQETPVVKSDRYLVKVIDYLGRETRMEANKPLIKIYSDGSVERVISE